MRLLAELTAFQIVYAKSMGCGKPADAALGEPTNQTLVVGSDTRRYLLTIPEDYDANKPYPLVLSFHGYGMDADSFASYDGIVPRARNGQVIAVHPDGSQDVSSGPPWKSWNAVGSSATSGASATTCDAQAVEEAYNGTPIPSYDSCPGDASGCGWSTCRDDVQFVEELLNAVEGAYCVDDSQVRLQAESNGGMLVYEILQSRLASRFVSMTAMIASPASSQLRAPAAPVRFLGIWGEADPVMPVGSPQGPETVRSEEGFFYSSSFNTTSSLAKQFGCGTEPEVALDHPHLQCKSYPNCKEGEVMQCILPGRKHVWPSWTDVLIHSFNARKIKPEGPWADFWSAVVENRTKLTDPDEWEAEQKASGNGPLGLIEKLTLPNSLSEDASHPPDVALQRAKSLSVFTKQATVHRVLLRPQDPQDDSPNSARAAF